MKRNRQKWLEWALLGVIGVVCAGLGGKCRRQVQGSGSTQRNVEFTGPYFHDGSQATLDQVVEFYGRNGDFPGDGNLGPGIGGIRLKAGERTSIVAFLKALSDDRVRFQKAPFDHPALCVPNGHAELAPGQLETDPSQAGLVALDKWALVFEVGREGVGVPLQTFDELLNGVGNDGSRANTMTTACKP